MYFVQLYICLSNLQINFPSLDGVDNKCLSFDIVKDLLSI